MELSDCKVAWLRTVEPALKVNRRRDRPMYVLVLMGWVGGGIGR